MIYLNHAGTSWPKPEPVRAATARAMDAPVDSWATELADAHSAVALGFGLESTDALLLTPGATSALAVAISDHAWQPGDRIVVSGLEHHALHRAAMLLTARGVDVLVALRSESAPIDLDALEATLRGGRVRVVAVTAASNVTGEVLPTAEISRIAHAHGACCVIDAAQTAGWRPLGSYLREGADLVAFAGHKAPQAPWGIGGLCMAPGVEMASPRVDVGADRAEAFRAASAPGYCDVGSVDRISLAGLAAGLSWLEEPERAHRLPRARAQIARIRTLLLELPGVTVHGPHDEEARTPVVAFTAERVAAGALAAQLETHGVVVSGGLQCAPLAHATLGTLPDGVVRVSVGPMTRDDEVEEAREALRQCTRTDRSG